MKRTTIFLACLLSLFAWVPVGAVDVNLPTFAPMTPEVKAQGGSFTAVSTGYNALFFNPAGFATDKNSLTILSLDPTANISLGSIKTVQDNLDAILSGDIMAAAKALTTIITTEGVGAQINGGAGWVGSGLGLGVATQASVFAKGTTILGTTAVADIIEGAVIGYALPVDLGFTTLKLGLDVRPMQRTYGEFSIQNASDPTAITLANGFGIGFDLGTMASFGPVTFGLSVRDIGGTRFQLKNYGALDVIQKLTLTDGSGKDPGKVFTTPMSINTGIAYIPDMGALRVLFQPMIHADLQIPVMGVDAAPSLLASSHFGAEVKVLSFLTIRAGLNQGWATFGLGAHLLFLDVNAAIYSDELGRYSGKDRKPGLSAEVALRF